jgi:hypothetical protein
MLRLSTFTFLGSGLALGCLEMDPAERRRQIALERTVAQDDEPGPSVFGPLFDSSYYLIENWLPRLLHVAFGAEDPATAYGTALDAIRIGGSQPYPSETDEGARQLATIDIALQQPRTLSSRSHDIPTSSGAASTRSCPEAAIAIPLTPERPACTLIQVLGTFGRKPPCFAR